MLPKVVEDFVRTGISIMIIELEWIWLKNLFADQHTMQQCEIILIDMMNLVLEI